jgi:glycosyltransferase involved in cell wall biosynthesis
MNDTAVPDLLSVAMPAYNEEASIEAVILEHVLALAGIENQIPRWEIVCVDDGSTDGTGAILDRMAAQISGLRVIHQPNAGIFGAVSRAYRESKGDYIYSTASDGQWPAENLETMLDALRSGADLVIGVRTNRRDVYRPARRLISYGFNLLPRILFGVTVKDAGSIKLGRREVFQFDLVSHSPFFEAERIIRARRTGLNVAFVPIRFLSRSGGQEKGASLKNIVGSLRDMCVCLRAYSPRKSAVTGAGSYPAPRSTAKAKRLPG